MYRLLIFCTFILSFHSCRKTNDCTPTYSVNCSIPDILNPICGCNGVTYDNKFYADCYQIEYTKGRCKYDNTPLLGTWDFLGYVSDGAVMNVDKKVHQYDMFITFKNEKTSISGSEYFIFEGKSAVNFMSGYYKFRNKGELTSNLSFSTKIGVREEDAKSENKFINYLNADTEFRIDKNYLEIKSRIYSQDGLAIPKDEVLIFKKK
ncbi:MAG: hypothetical protein WAT22_16820 [Saprospiraceae bacterium]|nr:hypothetical protein [Saprospiraceae bacterium]MBK9565425.1 hypothetical protein [Saprospiraceae bacterium]MBP6448468.1 hypothetical protein [Saprospiraceae bacterium]